MTGGAWRRTRKPPLGVVSTLLLAMALVATSAGLTPKGYCLATGEDFLFDALWALGRYSGRTFCDAERIQADSGMGKRIPAGEYMVLQVVKQFNARSESLQSPQYVALSCTAS